MVEIKDIMEPKWLPTTKRGVGMILAFASTVLPFVNGWVSSKYGVSIDAPLVAVLGQVVTNLLDAVGLAAGFVLMVWGMFRPTAPLTLFRR